jgi:hypothetical protein
MGVSVRRIRLVSAVVITAIFLLGSASTQASAAPAASSTPAVAASSSEYRDTNIVAGYPRLNGFTVSLRPSARLTDATTGLPLAGQEIVFWIGDAFFPSCTAVTDANGVAKCSGAQLQWQVLLSRTYEAVFGTATVGDIYYGLSRNRATLFAR